MVSCVSSFADEWTPQNTIAELSYDGLLMIDWAQTRSFLRQPESYHEANPILGQHPSNDKLTIAILSSVALHFGISYLMPQDWRSTFQAVSIGIEAMAVGNNYSLGISAKF